MEFEVMMFWLIHALILFLIPAFMYFGCCREEYEKELIEEMKAKEAASYTDAKG